MFSLLNYIACSDKNNVIKYIDKVLYESRILIDSLTRSTTIINEAENTNNKPWSLLGFISDMIGLGGRESATTQAKKQAREQKAIDKKKWKEKLRDSKDKLKAAAIKARAALDKNQNDIKMQNRLNMLNQQMKQLQEMEKNYKSNKSLFTQSQIEAAEAEIRKAQRTNNIVDRDEFDRMHDMILTNILDENGEILSVEQIHANIKNLPVDMKNQLNSSLGNHGYQKLDDMDSTDLAKALQTIANITDNYENVDDKIAEKTQEIDEMNHLKNEYDEKKRRYAEIEQKEESIKEKLDVYNQAVTKRKSIEGENLDLTTLLKSSNSNDETNYDEPSSETVIKRIKQTFPNLTDKEITKALDGFNGAKMNGDKITMNGEDITENFKTKLTDLQNESKNRAEKEEKSARIAVNAILTTNGIDKKIDTTKEDNGISDINTAITNQFKEEKEQLNQDMADAQTQAENKGIDVTNQSNFDKQKKAKEDEKSALESTKEYKENAKEERKQELEKAKKRVEEDNYYNQEDKKVERKRIQDNVEKLEPGETYDENKKRGFYDKKKDGGFEFVPAPEDIKDMDEYNIKRKISILNGSAYEGMSQNKYTNYTIEIKREKQDNQTIYKKVVKDKDGKEIPDVKPEDVEVALIAQQNAKNQASIEADGLKKIVAKKKEDLTDEEKELLSRLDDDPETLKGVKDALGDEWEDFEANYESHFDIAGDDDADADSDDPQDDDTKEYEDENGNMLKNPTLIWKRKKKANGTGMTIRYYNQDKSRSITRKERNKMIDNYQKARERSKQQQTTENITDFYSYIKTMIIENKQNSLVNYIQRNI